MKVSLLTGLLLLINYGWVMAQAKKDVYFSGGVYRELEFNKSFLYTGCAGASFYANDYTAIGAEANVYRFQNGDYSSVGIGLRPAMRFYPFPLISIRPFAEVKGGIIYMLPEYTYRAINFTFVTSLGIELRAKRNMWIRTNAGYNHFSNGQKYDRSKNPSWDGFGGSAGLVFLFW